MQREERVRLSSGNPIPPYTTDPALTFYCPQENVAAFDEPRIRALWDEMRLNYAPPALADAATTSLLLLPCTKIKPYLLSDEHRHVNRYLIETLGFAPVGESDAPADIYAALPAGFPPEVLHNGLLRKGDRLIHRMVISEPMGIVPYEYVYHWRDTLSIVSRYDDPGLFEHRGTAGCPWRADSTVTPLENNRYRWGLNEYAAYTEAHNRLTEQMTAVLRRLRPFYRSIFAYVAPEITHRSFINDAVAKAEEGMKTRITPDQAPLSGVNDHQPGLVRVIPDSAAMKQLQADIQQNNPTLSAQAVQKLFTLAGGEAAALILPETLAVLGEHIQV